jgi:bla regulator protein BlaR1
MLVSLNVGNDQLAYSPTSWTKGMIINSNEKTASKYEIMNIKGSDYMFCEWKSGDYVLGGMQPQLYVLKKADNKDYSNYSPSAKTDKVDYPFADDPQVIGKWKSVDFVKAIDDFNPEKQNWVFGLTLTGLDFGADGVLSESFGDEKYSESISWTKGLVLSQKALTASAYTIKEINGSTYLFYEWKSGDYVYRGMQPYYYVLKKEQ